MRAGAQRECRSPPSCGGSAAVLRAREFCGMGAAGSWRALVAVRARHVEVTQAHGEARASPASRRSDGRRRAVKERGRRQSGSTSSLSAGRGQGDRQAGHSPGSHRL